MPKVSVIIPVYNVEKYLRECLNSVINQTLKDIEIIIIDDGGKDNCPQIIDEYAQKDSRIIAIHKENGGYGQSCNIGLDKATGEYIAILEPDDFIDSNMYEDLYNIAINNDSDIVKSSYFENFDTPDFKHIQQIKWEREEQIPTGSFKIEQAPMFLYYHPSIWSAIYKREFINKNNILFVEAPGAGWTDNPFQVQTMCLAEKINYTKTAYYYWRILNSNQSECLNYYILPFQRCDEIQDWLKKNNIKNENILACLYIRELNYINIVLGMKNITDKKDCYIRIKKMCMRMDKNIILKNKYINNYYKKLYFQILISPQFLYYINLFEQFRKKFFQVHINKKEIYIKLFGRTISNLRKS